MKSLTLMVDDDLYEAVATEANKHQTSVSALVEGHLRTLAQDRSAVQSDRTEAEDRKNREELVRLFREANLVPGLQAQPRKDL